MTVLTIRGHVGADPDHGISDKGVEWARFRAARTERWRDQNGGWNDGRTTWFGVSCFNELAGNVALCIKKGDPVIVTGRLQIDEYSHEGGLTSTPVIMADAVGHDLRYGSDKFARRQRPGGPAPAESASTPENVDADGVIHESGAQDPGKEAGSASEDPDGADQTTDFGLSVV